MMSNKPRPWLLSTAEGDIIGYVRGRRERITANWLKGHLVFLVRWGLTRSDLDDIINKIEADPTRRHLLTSSGLRRLEEVREIIESLF